jgi:AraC family transcriptional regulator of adaptative response/methylated-DNA-[protein]-cysteine methyltransferase
MIFVKKFDTVLGTMIAGSADEGICLLAFSDKFNIEKEHTFLQKYFGQEIMEGESNLLGTLESELKEYFDGSRKSFTLPLRPAGTPFQKDVWKELMNIGFGITRTYHQQSIALGNPASIRAVANANGANRIAIVIPCHRVIGSDGSLTGYGGGLERKKWLLDHERKFSGKSFDLKIF